MRQYIFISLLCILAITGMQAQPVYRTAEEAEDLTTISNNERATRTYVIEFDTDTITTDSLIVTLPYTLGQRYKATIIGVADDVDSGANLYVSVEEAACETCVFSPSYSLGSWEISQDGLQSITPTEDVEGVSVRFVLRMDTGEASFTGHIILKPL